MGLSWEAPSQLVETMQAIGTRVIRDKSEASGLIAVGVRLRTPASDLLRAGEVGQLRMERTACGM